jgi:predicted ATPase
VLNGLTSLVSKDLVVRHEQAGDVRFTLLEMIREYALGGSARRVKRMRSTATTIDYCLSLVETAEPQLVRSDQKRWLDRLE